MTRLSAEATTLLRLGETRGEALFRAVWQALAPDDREAVTRGVQRLGEALRAVAERKERSRAS